MASQVAFFEAFAWNPASLIHGMTRRLALQSQSSVPVRKSAAWPGMMRSRNFLLVGLAGRPAKQRPARAEGERRNRCSTTLR